MKYKKIVLKISGNEFSSGSLLWNKEQVDYILDQLQVLGQLGVEVAVVPGGGNIARGRELTAQGTLEMDELNADLIGMLAINMNGIVLRDQGEKRGMNVRLCSSIAMPQITESYLPFKMRAHMEAANTFPVRGAGIGNGGVSSDSAAMYTARDMRAEIVLKATTVDGIFDKDPRRNPDAVRLSRLTHDEFLSRNLNTILDPTSVIYARDARKGGIPICVFDFKTPGALEAIIRGEQVGSLISSSPEATA
ncbi:MAG: UMP kinase [Patescibacteria group bacterium]